MEIERSKPKLPDVAETATDLMATPLEWVGMTGIEIPILVSSVRGDLVRVPARATAFVSLDQAQARGIHMSRLFKITQDELSKEILSFSLLQKIIAQFLESHSALSKSAQIKVDFEAMVLRQALKSANQGWRNYPVQMSVTQKPEGLKLNLRVLVTYSSTCPASAALSRALIQDNFMQNFATNESLDFEQVHQWLGTTKGIIATPHAQRSVAEVEVTLSPDADFGFEKLIDILEEAVQTPVQSVVKREDEQEFALRNGQNLMFCEDAARRVKASLSGLGQIQDFHGHVRHIESLHPHDAVSFFRK